MERGRNNSFLDEFCEEERESGTRGRGAVGGGEVASFLRELAEVSRLRCFGVEGDLAVAGVAGVRGGVAYISYGVVGVLTSEVGTRDENGRVEEIDRTGEEEGRDPLFGLSPTVGGEASSRSCRATSLAALLVRIWRGGEDESLLSGTGLRRGEGSFVGELEAKIHHIRSQTFSTVECDESDSRRSRRRTA
jgi:hypothetical protein